MIPIAARPITHEEAVVTRTALERAATHPDAARLIATIPTLNVIGRCECGCASVDFTEVDPNDRPTLLADASAATPSGGAVGVIVWGTPSHICELEIYDLGSGQEGPLCLPDPESIAPW